MSIMPKIFLWDVASCQSFTFANKVEVIWTKRNRNKMETKRRRKKERKLKWEMNDNERNFAKVKIGKIIGE